MKRRPHGVSSAILFQIHQFAVSSHAVSDPGIVVGAWTYFRTPPLVGNGIGQQADARFVGDPRTQDCSQLRRPDRRQSVVRQLHHVHVAGLRLTKAFSKEVVLFGHRLGHLVAGRLVAHRQVDLHVAGSRGEWAQKTSSNHCAGKAGFGPVEVVFITGFAAGQLHRARCTLVPAGEDLHSLRHADVDLRREPVDEIAGHGEPSRRVEQIGDGLLDGGQL